MIRSALAMGCLTVLSSLALAQRAIAFSPCESGRDCASGFCAGANGVCCADPCDFCDAEGACVTACLGDCDDSGSVSVADLVTASRVVLGIAAADRCAAFAAAGVADLTMAVRRSLDGCPGLSLGDPCFASGCAVGFCRDGYCCDDECAGGRCDVAGFEGVCIPTGGLE